MSGNKRKIAWRGTMQTKNRTQAMYLKCPPFLCQFPTKTWCKFSYLVNWKLKRASSLSSWFLWCMLFQIKLGLFKENLSLKKYLCTKHRGSKQSRFWHRLKYSLPLPFLYHLHQMQQACGCLHGLKLCSRSGHWRWHIKLSKKPR